MTSAAVETMTTTTAATPPEMPADLLMYAQRLARKKARELVGHYGWKKGDVEDIEQDLLFDLLRRWPKYDPARSKPKAFVGGVFKHRILSMIESRLTFKHDYEREKKMQSLNKQVAVRDGQPFERGELIEDGWDDHADYDMVTSVATALANLPDDLRRACELFKQGVSVCEVARRLGVPVTTLRERFAKERDTFARAGLVDDDGS